MPISVSNPDLLRHSTELFMDSGFSPLCQRMGAMVAFRRFEEFTRNFDEVISCFANVPVDTPLFSKPCTSLYSEEDSKVSPMGSVVEEGWALAPPSCPQPLFLPCRASERSPSTS